MMMMMILPVAKVMEVAPIKDVQFILFISKNIHASKPSERAGCDKFNLLSEF